MTIDYTVISSSLAGLDFLGKFARAIIEGVGMIGLGIIVFTLVLKAITLPFDIYQRYKTRKQTLIMRGMKDDLDKLQKQYANDKTTYNQKMMELYKKNGYSMFGACLPMILSLVILIVAFQGFNSYSRYANVKQFVDMTGEFNEVVLGHATDGSDYYLFFEETEDTLVIPLTKAQIEAEETWQKSEDGVNYELVYVKPEGEGETEEGEEKENTVVHLNVSSEGEGIFMQYRYLLGSYVKSAETGEVDFVPVAPENIKRNYYIDLQLFKAYLGEEAETDASAKTTLDSINEKQADETPENREENKQEIESLCRNYVDSLGAAAAKEYYLHHKSGFLWIKNVWESDATYRHPVPKSTPNKNAISALDYTRLTSQLGDQKKAYNGYYILIILSIGTMILSQIITMRSQKEATKYQTADGQGAKTQKFMLV